MAGIGQAITANIETIAQAVEALDAWLETMRGTDGYGGPVAHWWQNCLQFTGAGLDWRYESITIGYVNLYEKTGEERWLAKARRAGDDLVRGQLPGGNYRNSCFELNPYTGGTPHEAACDLALLHLAEVLREQGDPAWQTYLTTAERNLRGYYIKRLWDPEAWAFRDHPCIPSFVPNKAATLVEALLMLARLAGDKALAEVYALPTLENILAHQVRGGMLVECRRFASLPPGKPEAKAIGLKEQSPSGWPSGAPEGLGSLSAGVQPRPSAARTADSLHNLDDSSLVVYPGRRVNRYPLWIAGVGDVLRAMALLKPYGFEADPQPTLAWPLRGQEPTGGFRTAHGFASQISQRKPGPLPEFRDLLPVVGWSSMAFRYLAEALPTVEGRTVTTETTAEGRPLSFEAECVFRGQQRQYREGAQVLELRRNGKVIYRWYKGTPWAEVCAPEMLWK